jgi:hypothetical protein
MGVVVTTILRGDQRLGWLTRRKCIAGHRPHIPRSG